MQSYQLYEILGNVGIASFLLVVAFGFGMVSSIRKRKRILERGILRKGVVISAERMKNDIYVIEVVAEETIYAVGSWKLKARKYHVGSEVSIITAKDDKGIDTHFPDNIPDEKMKVLQQLQQDLRTAQKLHSSLIPDDLPILADEMPSKAPAIIWGGLAVFTMLTGIFMVWYSQQHI